MLTRDYLMLQLIRLKSGEEWTDPGGGLCFVFVRGGAGTLICQRLHESCVSGDVLVLSGAPGGKLCVSSRDEMVFWYFSANTEYFFPLFAGNEICLLPGILEEFKPFKCYPASSPLARECHKLVADVPPQFNLDHRSQLLRVAGAILSAEFTSAHRRRVGYVRAEDHIIQVFETLPAHDLLNLSVGQLAEKFGCSRRHLNRLFHQYFSVSVATLRMELRMSKAVTLLRDADAKIIRVAEECGFNHLGLFNTCFKRRFGVSPGQWRKKAQSKQGLATDPWNPGSLCSMSVNGFCPWKIKPGVDHQGASSPGGTHKTASSAPPNIASPMKQRSPSQMAVEPEPLPHGLIQPSPFQLHA